MWDLITNLFAAAPAQQGAGAQGGMSFFVMIGGMILIFYFMLIRPQSQQQKKHKSMLEALQKGDKILTRGGIYGTIEKVSDHSLRVKVAEGVILRMSKTAVASKTSADEKED